MSGYLQFNFALAFFGLLAIASTKLNLNFRQKVKVHYTLIIMSILVVPTIYFLPVEGYQYLAREIINAPMNLTSQSFYKVHKAISSGPINDIISYDSKTIPNLVLIIILCMVGIILFKTFKTYREIKNTFLHKSIGRISVLVSDKKQSPYSFSFLNKSYIVLPQFLLENRNQFKIAFKHEVQHIRNRDTFWVYIFELAVSICFMNPVVYYWRKQTLLDQEFACDESLIAQYKVQPRAYANCILQVAELTSSHHIPYGVTGMAWGKMKQELLWRIIKMKEIKKESKSLFNTIIVTGALLFTTSVFALQIQPNKLTQSELQNITQQADFNQFPIDINESVLGELNRFFSNPKWREFTRKSLKRYESYKGLIDRKAIQYNLPTEISAIAFIESGFVNLPDRSTSISSKGAGMWQFIPSTARKFGLTVNKQVDERMDIPKATDAAMRYLAGNYYRFQDLRLAMMSYYVGEGKIHNDIIKYGTSNPWELIENGNYKTPYLARAMAAAILLKFPSLIE